jgi:glycolate oxidase iron-sulfur subunit
MVKDYKDLLQYDSDYAKKAARISAATKDISEILLAEDLSLLAIDNNVNVAFQSPCTLQHGQQLSGVVESILQQLGFNLISVNDAHLCCGSAGVYSLLQPALSERLLNDKLSVLQANEPDIIATANIGCLKQLQSVSSTRVVHWMQLLG